MRPEVIGHLRCPVCHDPLTGPTTPRGPLRCGRGHSFDQARQGYVQLSARPLAHTGDSPAMIEARARFLGTGHFDPILTAVRDAAVAHWRGGLIVDVGAGTGDYLARTLDALPAAVGLATDASKAAARASARAHDRAGAIVCDAWRELPVADAAAGLVLNVFAPRPGPEFARVLRPGGALIVVTPTGEHQRELVEALGLLRVDPDKAGRLAAALEGRFTPGGSREVTALMPLARDELGALVGMGPSARHLDPATLAGRMAALADPVPVTLSVTVSVHHRR